MFERLKTLFASKPPRIYQHPVYGRFEAEAGEPCWIGRIEHDGLSLSLSILGSDSQPDVSRLEAVAHTLAQLTSLRATALDFIVGKQPDSQRHEFTLTGLDFGCVRGLDSPDFEFEFKRTGDVDGIWCVVFRSGVPEYLGRDS
jgi:hypothetical protein